MQSGAARSGLDHGGRLAVHALHELLAPRPRLVVLVPVERGGDDEALGGLQAQRMHVADEDQETGQSLPGLDDAELGGLLLTRSEEHTSELQSLMRISYAVFCLKKKKNNT